MAKIKKWELRQKGMSRDFDVYAAGVPDSAGKIARVFSRDGRDHIARTDAILIAAAPLLLAALERAISLYGKQGGPWNVPSEAGSWIAEAEAAVQEARKEKPCPK